MSRRSAASRRSFDGSTGTRQSRRLRAARLRAARLERLRRYGRRTARPGGVSACAARDSWPPAACGSARRVRRSGPPLRRKAPVGAVARQRPGAAPRQRRKRAGRRRPPAHPRRVPAGGGAPGAARPAKTRPRRGEFCSVRSALPSSAPTSKGSMRSCVCGAATIPIAWVVDARLVSPRLEGWREDALGNVDYAAVRSRASSRRP